MKEKGLPAPLDHTLKINGQSSSKEIEKRKEEERLIKLRSELVNYNFHACPRVMKESFRGLDVDDIDLIRIALIGPAASGKTSFVGK